jgi:hypothetical protein
MLKKAICACAFILIIQLYLLPQSTKLDQRQGLLQDKTDSHVLFENITRLDFSRNQISFKKITKLALYKDRLFVLDRMLSQIFVFDMEASYLYSIGRPGQGPGDLEYPGDFFISQDDLVYVLNSMSKRIEIFTLAGEFIRRIELMIPKEIPIAYPEGFVVARDGFFLLTYKLAPHYLDIYGAEGKFEKTLLSRNEKIFVPGANIGNCSQVLLLNQGNEVLHFNHFSGIFSIMDHKGSLRVEFSVFNKAHQDAMSISRTGVNRKNQEKNPTTYIETNYLYSNVCQDNDGRLYTFFQLNKANEPQKLFVFSSKGDFLYWSSVPFFRDKKITDIYSSGDTFIFITQDDEVYLLRKVGK